MTLDKNLFYNGDDEFDSEHVYEGAIVPMRTTDGQIVNAQVIEITDDKVTIDLNHPLAGKDLHFVGMLLEARPATDEELQRLTSGCCGCHGGCEGGGCEGGGCEGGGCDNNSCCEGGKCC